MLKYISIFTVLIIVAATASAQVYLRKDTQTSPQIAPINKSKAATTKNAKIVAQSCLGGDWEQQKCLKAVSQNNLVMASNYGSALQESGKANEAELIKQNCAASTAATRDEFSAYAMKSAYVECVNVIADVASATKMLPDQSQYQLLVAAIQCLNKTDACAHIEKALMAYKN